VAGELGVNEETLGSWVREDRTHREARDGALGKDERAELVRLRREVAELKMRWPPRHDPEEEGPVAEEDLRRRKFAAVAEPPRTNCRRQVHAGRRNLGGAAEVRLVVRRRRLDGGEPRRGPER
jgi:transposase-like protein